MEEGLILFLQNALPRELATIILAALPLTELRLAIPIAMLRWLMNPWNAWLCAVIGNMLPFFPLYFGLRALEQWAEKHIPAFASLIAKSVDRARKRVEGKYNRYGAVALFLFTALPLPMTGLYTATLAAVALKIPWKYALISTFIGVITAGIIVTAATLGLDTWI